jgi:hypothetical protein
MDFELKLENPNNSRAWILAATMGSSYIVGMRGSLRPPFHKFAPTPMLPYFVIDTVVHALFVSIGITAVILLVFGYIKDWFTYGLAFVGTWCKLQDCKGDWFFNRVRT